MAFTAFFTYDELLEDYNGEPWVVPIPPGHHQRHRFVVRRRRADLHRRGGHIVGYSKSTHVRSRQVGPMPLPFRHQHIRWRT
jgi:hypothetical protein